MFSRYRSFTSPYWGLHNAKLSPLARLCAFYVADHIRPSDTQAFNRADICLGCLSAWLGLQTDDVQPLLDEISAADGLNACIANGRVKVFLEMSRGFPLPGRLIKPGKNSNIYVMSGGDLCKVGISRAPKQRADKLLADGPLPSGVDGISLMYAEGDNEGVIKFAERIAHEYLQEFRVFEDGCSATEWFDIDIDTAIEAAQIGLSFARGERS